VDIIAQARIDIEMTRLLCLKAAWLMDNVGTDAAQPYISMIKVAAPSMALKIIDEAMQMYGGLGLSQDTPLAIWYGAQRTLRFADGPDAVHRMVIGRREFKQYM
jgi:acyl-CoA dehydrogenase